MKAVVLAAGEGRRLRPLTRARPKALLEVAGEPILARCLRTLRELEPEAYVVVVGRLGDRIEDRFGGEYDGVPIEYALQRERKGLAHALLAAEPSLAGDFLAMHGDNVFRADLRPVVERHAAERPAATILVEPAPPSGAVRGACAVDARGRVVGAVEHPGPGERRWGFVVAGFYAFSPVIFSACRGIPPSARGELELPDALSWLIERGLRVNAVTLRGERVNVNTPADLAAAERLLEA